MPLSSAEFNYFYFFTLHSYFFTRATRSGARQVDQKTILTAAMLVLCERVVDHWKDVTVSLADENNVKVTGRKKVKIHGGLSPGETVLLVRMQGGKKFAVIDRIKPAVDLSGEWIE